VVPGKGVDVAGGPIPRKPGYYGQPVVKPPVWTWEIPLYFFMGGLAGMSAVIASGAVIFHQVDLARAAMWIAAIAGAVLSPVLLIMDLGRPRLFLNMLRVFKHRSAMSMGAWILSAFGACAVPGLIALELHAHHFFDGAIGQLLRVAAAILIFGVHPNAASLRIVNSHAKEAISTGRGNLPSVSTSLLSSTIMI